MLVGPVCHFELVRIARRRRTFTMRFLLGLLVLGIVGFEYTMRWGRQPTIAGEFSLEDLSQLGRMFFMSIMAIQVATLLSGAVITEAIFGIPGVGRISVSAIQSRDMPLLQGSVLFATALVILGNLIADMLYSVLDPRIRSQMTKAAP